MSVLGLTLLALFTGIFLYFHVRYYSLLEVLDVVYTCLLYGLFSVSIFGFLQVEIVTEKPTSFDEYVK